VADERKVFAIELNTRLLFSADAFHFIFRSVLYECSSALRKNMGYESFKSDLNRSK